MTTPKFNSTDDLKSSQKKLKEAFPASQDAFLKSIHAEFLSQSKTTPIISQLYPLFVPDDTQYLSKEELISGILSLRFNFVVHYLKRDFISAVQTSLHKLPFLILQLLYTGGINIVIDTVSSDSGVYQIDNKTITLSERFVIDDTIIYNEENYFLPEGLDGVILHELGHYFDWNLGQEYEKLSSHPEFWDAWQEDLAHIPAAFNITYEEGKELCKAHGGYVFLPVELKKKVDFQGFLPVEQEVFAECFLYLMHGSANPEVIRYFSRSLKVCRKLILEAFIQKTNFTEDPSPVVSGVTDYEMTTDEKQQEEFSELDIIVLNIDENQFVENTPIPPYLLMDHQVFDSGIELGGKARNLSYLSQNGFMVPGWFVITPQAFYDSIPETYWDAYYQANSFEEIQLILDHLSPPQAFCDELKLYLHALCPNGERLAVRSSAPDEDGEHHSFAGMLDSFLYVHPSQVLEHVIRVWKSGFGERILQYYQENNIGNNVLSRIKAPAVIVQYMVPAETAGVAFGLNPLTADPNSIVISSVLGLGSALVSGEVNGDTHILNKNSHNDNFVIQETQIGYQHLIQQFNPEENCVQNTTLDPQFGNAEKLTPSQIQQVAQLVVDAGHWMGSPQDIEWAFCQNVLYLLQSRPITTTHLEIEKKNLIPTDIEDTTYQYFYNELVIDTLGGVVTPLTYSIQRKFYGAFYKAYLLQSNVIDPNIHAHEHLFSNLLCLVKGKAYLNYSVMETLWQWTQSPGQVWEELKNSFSFNTFQSFCSKAIKLGSTLFSIGLRTCNMSKNVAQFQTHINSSLENIPKDITSLGILDLVQQYHRIAHIQQNHWQVPAFSESLATYFYTLLGTLTQTWCGDETGTLQNDLIGDNTIFDGKHQPLKSISTEIHEALCQLAKETASYPDLVSILNLESLDTILDTLDQFPDLKQSFRNYLNRFGDRCQEDSKIESLSVREDLLPFLRSVGLMAEKFLGKPETVTNTNPQNSCQFIEIDSHKTNLSNEVLKNPIKKFILNQVVHQARLRLVEKENLRFDYTRLMAAMRKILREIGYRLYASQAIAHPEDISYLEIEEILGFIQGTGSTPQLMALIQLRKEAYQQYAQEESPTPTFETYGMVHHSQNSFRMLSEQNLAGYSSENFEDAHDEILWGKGSSKGWVEAQVQIAYPGMDPNACRGKILIAEHSDPGYITYFPLVKGLVFEYGSPLSHSSIVARELGIPTIVSARGISQWLQNGEQIQMNGQTGCIQKFNP